MPISRLNRNTVLITMGDPSGIGPEVILKSLASPRVKGLADFLIIGDRFVIDKTRKDLRLKVKTDILDLSNVPDRASLEYIDEALRLFKNGFGDALVTAPVNKLSIIKSGEAGFTGHTEYLAKNTGTKNFAMMFVGERLKVALVTRHIALKDVPLKLSTDAVYRTIMLTHRYLKDYFGVKNPRIGVAGLNPHAGEGSSFGKEDARIIAPAVRKALVASRGVAGPLPADTLFYEALHRKFDAVVAMYHDQALAPFKMLYFTSGVNLTIGLPFIRTSPDHGTAFDIAGRGIADPSSMTEAILLACRLSKARLKVKSP